MSTLPRPIAERQAPRGCLLRRCLQASRPQVKAVPTNVQDREIIRNKTLDLCGFFIGENAGTWYGPSGCHFVRLRGNGAMSQGRNGADESETPQTQKSA